MLRVRTSSAIAGAVALLLACGESPTGTPPDAAAPAPDGAIDAGPWKNPTGLLFGIDDVPTFHLFVDDEGLDELLVRPRQYVCGDFRHLDQTYANVGIRLKGGPGSFAHLDGKSAFKVKFNHPDCGDSDRRFFGLESPNSSSIVGATNTRRL